MQETTKNLCEVVQGCKLGYVESDEISLLLTDYESLTTDAWFNYAVEKLCSVSAALATMHFNRNFTIAASKYLEKVAKGEVESDEKYITTLYTKIAEEGYFDARAFNIPETEVTNYFIWRQQDSSRNSIAGLGRAYFSTKELHGLSGSAIQDKLHEEKGINWNNLSVPEKRGTCIVKKDSEWIIDKNIPIFTQDRNYIECRLPERS